MGAPQADAVARMKRAQVPSKESGGRGGGKMAAEETTGKDIKPEPMIAGPCGQMPQSQTLSWMSRGAMAFSVMVFLFESVAYNVVFVGRILPAANKAWLAIPCAALFNVVWTLAFWSYVQAHWSDAGAVPDSWHSFVRDSGDCIAIVAPRVAPPGWQPGKATHCKKCAASRPERSHHCQVCQRCVLRYDHHCPWINNCVGFCNHKFFLLLAIYGCLTSFVFCTTSIPQVAFCIAALASPADEERPGRIRLDVGDLVTLIISNLLSLAVGCLLALLLSIHLPLAMRNLTTVEDYYENMPNPFDQGGAAENLAQIFGVYGPDWLIPIKPLRPLSDGICFPRSEDSRGPDGLPDDIRERSEREKYAVWRSRYHQMPPPGREVQPEPSNPLESLTRWWNTATSWQSNNETSQSLLVV